MRYYLDTNIIYFLLFNPQEISSDILDVLGDYETITYTSSECIKEFLHLFETDNLSTKKIKANNVIDVIKDDLGITIVPFTEKHLRKLAELPYYEKHKDPNDRIIIAQAISDKIPIISSDNKFHNYVQDGLKFMYNKR